MKATPDKSIKLFPQPAHGQVEQAIAPEHAGRVRFQGSIWKAKFADSHYEPVMPGESVKVLGVQGITLVVVPEE
jgi:membrane protein implicated in regulation of membrane protease activity